jgi:hypothetical protein
LDIHEMKPVVLISLVLLAACGPRLEPDTPTTDCRADDMQALIGQPRTVLETMRLQGPLRILGPNDAMTMDYRTDRTNIEIAEDGRISRIWCG